MELQPVEAEQRPGLIQTVFLNERCLRAGWRLLIFVSILFVVARVINLIITLVLRPGNTPPPRPSSISPFSVLPAEVAGIALVLFASWVMSRIEHRDLGEYGLPVKNSGLLSQFVVGYLFWGFLPLAVLLLIMRALHVFYFGNLALHNSQVLYWGLLWWVVFLCVGIFEEYLFRGYLLYTLSDGIGFWPGAIILAVLFAVGHAMNPGETRIGVLMTAVFTIFAAMTLWRTGNLSLAVGAHAGWDWGESYC